MAENSPGSRKGGTRSPVYPAFSLDEAIVKLKALWEKDGKVGAPKSVALGYWGYTAISGPALRTISTLKRFGLTEERDGRILPSQIALDLLLYSNDDERYKKVLRECAKKPNIYSELFNKYGKDLPSNEALKAELIKDYDYNPKVVDTLINDFRNTLQLSGLLQAGTELEVGDDSELSTDKSKVPPLLRGKKKVDSQFIRLWSLTGGITATLELSDIPSQDDQDFLKICLDRALKELSEAKKNPDTGAETKKLGD